MNETGNPHREAGEEAIRRRGAMGWLRRNLHIVVPCLVLGGFAAPAIPYMLPADTSYQGEDYQPVKALKFFETRGRAYHKYAPMTDILLGPGYAVSMAYWYLTGDFDRPSGDFPYGLARPLEQLGFLLLQGRALFLLLVLAGGAALMRSMELAPVPRWIIGVGFLMLCATSWPVIYYSANTRPEAPQMAFVAAMLACYVRMIYARPTKKLAALMSAFAALAVTSKELSATVFVLPYAGYAAWLWWRGRADADLRARFWPIIAAGVGAGVATYLVLNVLYAPDVWWTRMQHWLSGSGLDHDVWLPEATPTAVYGGQVVMSLVDVLGPAGFVLAVGSLAGLILWRPEGWWLLLLPFVSVFTLGLLPIGYGGARFYTLAAVTLVPPCVVGLGAWWSVLGRQARRIGGVAVGLAVAANLVCATLALHLLDMQAPLLIERHLKHSGLPGGSKVYVLDYYPARPGASRLGLLGYEVETRSVQQIGVAPPETRPDRVYSTTGMLAFIDEARDMPARAKVLREAGFRTEDWRGLEALGYRRVAVLEPRTPAWFPFDWLPGVTSQERNSKVVVFDKAR